MSHADSAKHLPLLVYAFCKFSIRTLYPIVRTKAKGHQGGEDVGGNDVRDVADLEKSRP